MAGILKRLFGRNRKKQEAGTKSYLRDDNYAKILFRLYDEILDKWTVETMWAEIVNIEMGLYKLDNIPFYAPSIASDDIVFAEYDEYEKMLTFRKTIEYSGNSTIHVVVVDKSVEINSIRDIFKEMGCISERANDGYFSMEILASADYKPIKQKLDELENIEIISYAESCLSNKHQY